MQERQRFLSNISVKIIFLVIKFIECKIDVNSVKIDNFLDFLYEDLFLQMVLLEDCVLFYVLVVGRYVRLVLDFDDFVQRFYVCLLCFYRIVDLVIFVKYVENYLIGCNMIFVFEMVMFIMEMLNKLCFVIGMFGFLMFLNYNGEGCSKLSDVMGEFRGIKIEFIENQVKRCYYGLFG